MTQLNLNNNSGNINLTGEWPEKDDDSQWKFVLSIDFRQNNIEGKIPNLTYPIIYSLYLSGNKFEGEFNPSTINLNVFLTNLQQLHLSYNELSSLHESVSILTRLEELHLQDNSFTGPVPTFLMNLTNLTYLGIADNEFTNLPQNIGDLQQLEILYASRNNITSLPDSIGDILTLKSLQMGQNKLNTLPETLANLQNAPLGEGLDTPEAALNFYSNSIDSIPNNICPALDERIVLLDNNLCEEYHLDCLDSEYEWGTQDCKKVRRIKNPISPQALSELRVLERDVEGKFNLSGIGENETPFSEEEFLGRTFTPEFKFKASHFKNQKFLPMIIKMAVDVSDYYRENYWGGKPHRFYMNEFQILNDTLLEQEFPHRDEQLMSDFANYVDTLKSLKPGSSTEYPSTICNPDAKCVYTWLDEDDEPDFSEMSCTEDCDCNHDNPSIPPGVNMDDVTITNNCSQVPANKRYRDMELDSYYYYDRLGIGIEGHIITNSNVEKTGFYDGTVPGEYRANVIFDRFGGYIWSVLEKLAIASDRRLPIQIHELDFYEENYCKRFETIGMTRGEMDDGTINEQFDSHFNPNHPDYKICKKHNEMTANGGKGNHLFGKRNADDTGWEETPEDQAARYGLVLEYLDTCDIAAPYLTEDENGGIKRTQLKDGNFPYRKNNESHYGNIDTLYELKAQHLTNLYYKLYSHPNVTCITNWNWFDSEGPQMGTFSAAFGHRFIRHPETSDYTLANELNKWKNPDTKEIETVETGAEGYYSTTLPSHLCHSSLSERYNFVKSFGGDTNSISDMFSDIGFVTSPSISILDFRTTANFELIPMKSMEAHKAFISQHDWIGETNMSVLTNGGAEHVRVPFGKYDVYVLQNPNGDSNNRTEGQFTGIEEPVKQEYIHYGSVNIPLDASGVFNQDIRTDSQPMEDYIEVDGKLEVISISGQDDKNPYTPQGLNIKLRIKP